MFSAGVFTCLQSSGGLCTQGGNGELLIKINICLIAVLNVKRVGINATCQQSSVGAVLRVLGRWCRGRCCEPRCASGGAQGWVGGKSFPAMPGFTIRTYDQK